MSTKKTVNKVSSVTVGGQQSGKTPPTQATGPQGATTFRIGQKVRVTNGYGLDIGVKTIIGINSTGRYFLTPTDTPWFSWHESALKAIANSDQSDNGNDPS